MNKEEKEKSLFIAFVVFFIVMTYIGFTTNMDHRSVDIPPPWGGIAFFAMGIVYVLYNILKWNKNKS